MANASGATARTLNPRPQFDPKKGRNTPPPKKSSTPQAPKHPGKPPKATLVVKVDRARWARGVLKGPRYLWSSKTKRSDIAGFILRAAGVKERELDKKSNLRSLSEDVWPQIPPPMRPHNGVERGLALLLTCINDDPLISEKKREQELAERCSWHEIQLVFEGKG